jgi:hypothetical protein
MRKVFVMTVLAVLMFSLAVGPALAEVIEVIPGDGGSGIDTSVGTELESVITSESGRAPDGSIQIAVRGKYVMTDVKPFLDEANRTQAPFRAIGEALGCTVEWEEQEQKVTCSKEGFIVEMFIGNSTYWVNGSPLVMDTAPQLKENRTFIPVRALGEALDCAVYWNESAQLVLIWDKE